MVSEPRRPRKTVARGYGQVHRAHRERWKKQVVLGVPTGTWCVTPKTRFGHVLTQAPTKLAGSGVRRKRRKRRLSRNPAPAKAV